MVAFMDRELSEVEVKGILMSVAWRKADDNG